MTSSLTKTRNLAYMAVFAALITICSWITVPTVVPFTLQTFAVFAALGILGGKRGTVSVLVFIAMGAVGLPVFSGFKGGFGVLLGTTGGYIVGFIFMGLIYWAMEKLPLKGKSETAGMAVSMLLGLIVCYAFGTAWFMVAYAKGTGPIGIGSALAWCVIPFIIPDLLKMAAAILISSRVKKYIR